MTSSVDEKWNVCVGKPPDPFTTLTTINLHMQKKITLFREELYQILTQLGGENMRCLHAEAALLSRFLYRQYRSFHKDKGFQRLKMIMTCLNKYLRMDLTGNLETVRNALPHRFSVTSPAEELPSRNSIGWLLSRIQAFCCLFYRVFQLTKDTGRQIYERLRLNWNPRVLIMALCIAARLHVIARFYTLQAVRWYESILPYIRTFKAVDVLSYGNYPRDIKAWMGGLKDLEREKQGMNTTVSMVLELIDLTGASEETEDEQIEFVESIKTLKRDIDPDVQRVFEVVNLADTTVPRAAEDLGEPVIFLGEGNSGPLQRKRNKRKLEEAEEKPEIVLLPLEGTSCVSVGGGVKRKRKSELGQVVVDLT